ncbi:hypothetical protein [Xylanibacter muris]|uniref:Uncharacterized protein n=1 Tax=Xylanibacter muris TaxID=2736290 RepID=A0ABX2AJK7_9BACT|nr:hypothetical protein [Xylanibacter muris]NPD91338.1 hypothetical protein [Xylanibacter muris]
METFRPNTYHTLEDIQTKKEELHAQLQSKGEQIAVIWEELFVPKKTSTKGEFVTSIISNSITAFDAFMLVRKIMKQYGSIFSRKKKRR